ncbi:MAG: transglutaminase family protein [Potamolinea sp.]
MNLKLQTNDLKEYLAASEIIDYHKGNISTVATKLSENTKNEIDLAKTVYEYVRDNISHSFDINSNLVTCEASSVLEHKQGICYAKSHLLAAILRYLKIPTGFCYQKLILDDSEKPWFTLHGLNAIYLGSLNKWIRVDARGNKEGVQAEFNLEKEVLAFPVREKHQEIDYPIIYTKPNEKVVESLKKSQNREDLLTNLPDEL